MQKITPFLWFNNNAEEAVKYYVSVFEDGKILQTTRYDEAGSKASGQPLGSVMTVAFEIAGTEFVAINGGVLPGADAAPVINTVSFVVNCETQKEVDYYWEKLASGGEEGVCGWINHDKFGVTWQITPTILPKLLADPDKAKAQRVMEAMIQMKKIEIAELEKAANS